MKTLLVPVAALIVSLSGCTHSPSPSSDSGKTRLDGDVSNTLADFTSKDSGFQAMLDSAAGYAVFPEIGKGGAIVGGSYGHGEAFENKAMIGYCDITQGTIGAQLGGQTFSEVIVFRDARALSRFKSGEFTFAANATAVAIKQGAASSPMYADGAAAFIRVKGGLMAEAAIGGQQLRFTPK